MQKKKTVGRIVNLFLVIWIICIPLFWHFDLAVGNSDNYDAFSMATYAPVHIAIFYFLVFLSVYLNGFSLLHILVLGLYFPLVQLANFPYFTIRDVFLQGAPAQRVVANGQLVNPGPTVSPLSGPSLQASWPGAYFLQGILMEVTGADVMISNYILYICLMVAVLLVIYSFSLLLRRKNYSLGWAGALLFLPLFFNYIFDNFHLYSDTAFAFALYFVFILVFMRFENRPGLILSSMLIAAITLSHPFQNLAVTAFLCIYAVLRGGKPSRVTFLALFSTVSFVAWMLFQTSGAFPQIIGMLDAFFSPQYTTSLSQSLTAPVTIPWWATLFNNYFKYTLAGLLGIAILAGGILFFKLKPRTKVTVGSTSILLSSIIMLFGLLLLPDWKVARWTAFAAFPAAFSLVLLAEIRRNKKVGRLYELGKRFIVPLLLIFLASFSAASMVLRFGPNFYYYELYHPSEMASQSFFFGNNYNSSLFIVSWITDIYSAYFDYNYPHQVSMIWVADLVASAGNSSELLLEYSQEINASQFVLRGMRDPLTISGYFQSDVVLGSIDQEMLVPGFNQVYSNGNYALYGRIGT